MFWALFDQTGSAWVQQADKMDRNFLGFEWLPSQIQAINPIMIMAFIPIFNGITWGDTKIPGVYDLISKVFPLTPLRKISIGFFITVPAFLIPAWIEMQLDAGIQINIAWQLLAYVIITMAEVFVSITCLEFSYTQAPKKMKSFIMSAYLLSVSLGNIFVSLVNIFIQNDDGSSKIWQVLIITCSLQDVCWLHSLFVPYAMVYKEKHIFRMMTTMNQRLGKKSST